MWTPRAEDWAGWAGWMGPDGNLKMETARYNQLSCFSNSQQRRRVALQGLISAIISPRFIPSMMMMMMVTIEFLLLRQPTLERGPRIWMGIEWVEWSVEKGVERWLMVCLEMGETRGRKSTWIFILLQNLTLNPSSFLSLASSSFGHVTDIKQKLCVIFLHSTYTTATNNATSNGICMYITEKRVLKVMLAKL